MSFLALKNLLKYSTCHVARPRRQHMPNMLKNKTLLFVDSKKNKNKYEQSRSIQSQHSTYHSYLSSLLHAFSSKQNLERLHQINPRVSSTLIREA